MAQLQVRKASVDAEAAAARQQQLQAELQARLFVRLLCFYQTYSTCRRTSLPCRLLLALAAAEPNLEHPACVSDLRTTYCLS